MNLQERDCSVERIIGMFDMENVIPQRVDAVRKEIEILTMNDKTLIVKSGQYGYAIEFSVRINDYPEDSMSTVGCYVPGFCEGLLSGEGESMEEAICSDSPDFSIKKV